jgi:hypothetical protein
MITGAVVNVKDFGAIGNGVAHDDVAVSAAITYMFANNIATLYFPDGVYYFDAPVTVNFDAANALRLTGTSTAGFFSTRPGGSRIIGKSGITSLFIFTKTNLNTPGAYAFECTNIDFNGASGATRALLNYIGGSPMRPFVVKNCNFVSFAGAAIESDITILASNPGQNTGLYNVIIKECSFVACGLALYGHGGLGAIMGLDFSNNAAENGGGGILTTDLGLAGPFRITDNLLEGQANAIVLSCGLATGEISRNYYESNSGYLMQVVCSNISSSVTVRDNYILSSSGSKASFRNLFLICNQNFPDAGVYLYAPSLVGKSWINSGVVYSDLAPYGTITLDRNCVSTLTTVFPGTVSNGQIVAASGATEVTPIGAAVKIENVSGVGTLYDATGDLATGDLVVVSALARINAGSGIYVGIYDSAFVVIGGSDSSYALASVAKGEWVFIRVFVKVTAGSIGGFKFRWIGTGVDVTSAYVYSQSPYTATTPMYICLPNP